MRLPRHTTEYLIEASGLGAFMLSAGLFGALLWYPGSPLRQALPDPFVRRALMGIAMGLTAVAIIYSRWGKRSGAHINPAVTLTYLRLGKIEPHDALGYVLAQFVGGLAGLGIARALVGMAVADPDVNWVATVPGELGVGIAFVAELVISFVLMFVVLTVSNTPRIARYTGLCAGMLVALYIAFEDPLSGMSMNPARTFASALPSGAWRGAWIYFTAPLLGMLLAAQAFVFAVSRHAVLCAKLHHDNDEPCIFRCSWSPECAAGAVTD
jgi:aquaporin Z